jgi:hypothetical protein
MAYGLKYELIGKSAPFGKVWKVRLLKNGYTGAAIDRNVPANPFLLRKDSAGTIRGTSLEFSIRAIVDFEFIELYTDNVRDWLVQLVTEANEVVWSGFLLPEQYQEPYRPAPVNVSFTASDQLGLLKYVIYTAPSDVRISRLAVLNQCIDNCGLDLGFAVSIAIKEARQNQSRSVLSEIYINPEIYNTMTCYDVIVDILSVYNADITQFGSRWLIRDDNKLLPRVLYDRNGIFESIELAPIQKLLGQYGEAETDIWPTGGNLDLNLATTVKSLKITENYGTIQNIIPATTKENWISGSELKGWSKKGIVDYKRYDLADPYFTISGRILSTDVYANSGFTSIPGIEQTTDDIKLSFDFGVLSTISDTRYHPSTVVTIKLVGATTYYLSEKDGWKTSVSRIALLNIQNSIDFSSVIFSKFSILANGFPVSGTLYLEFSIPGPDNWQIFNNSLAGTAVKNLSLIFFHDEMQIPEGIVYNVNLNTSISALTKEIVVTGGDVPEIANKKFLFKNYASLYDGTVTGQWTYPGITGYLPLLGLLAKIYASANRAPRQYLKGAIRGQNIDFDTVINHSYPIARKFEILEASYDLCADKADVTLIELPDYVDVSFTEVVSDVVGSGSNQTTSNTIIYNETNNPVVVPPENVIVPDTRTILISGSVIWQSEMTYQSTKLVYKIVGQDYQITPSMVALDAADATFPRIDVFYVDSSSWLHILKGTPSIAPIKPVVAPGQLEITQAYIPAAATAPTIEKDLVYDENTEWDTSETHDTDIAIDFEATTEPKSGSRHIKVSIEIPETTQATPTHFIGEKYQGGIIFCMDSGGKTGLIAAETSVSKGTYYESLSGGGPYSTGATGLSIGSGLANSELLMAHDIAQLYAAANADGFTNDGFSDWFLGSVEEMKQLAFRKLLFPNLKGTFWSSSESDWNKAWCVSFDTLVAYTRLKNNAYNVVPIRKYDDTAFPVNVPLNVCSPLSTELTFIAPDPVNLDGGIISFYMKSSAEWLENSSILLTLYDNTDRVGFLFLGSQSGLYGYNSADPDWQQVALPVAYFSLLSHTINKMTISFVNSWPKSLNICIDKISIQHDANQIPAIVTQGTYGGPTKSMKLTVDSNGKVTGIEEEPGIVVKITQAAYNALETKGEFTLYAIVG